MADAIRSSVTARIAHGVAHKHFEIVKRTAQGLLIELTSSSGPASQGEPCGHVEMGPDYTGFDAFFRRGTEVLRDVGGPGEKFAATPNF
jgi:hypothetical protein